MLKRLRKLSRRKQSLLVIAIAAYILTGLSGGCGAYRRPAALTAEERVSLESAPLPYSVTVAWWDGASVPGRSPEAYATRLAKVVASSRAFKAHRYEASSTPSGQDLVATSTGLYCNTAVIPVLSILSLGVIPTIIQDEHCESMLLRRRPSQPRSEGVQIEVRYKGSVIMGWVAVVVGALPGWSYGSVDADSRFAERFRLAVIRRQAEIDRLATQ